MGEVNENLAAVANYRGKKVNFTTIFFKTAVVCLVFIGFLSVPSAFNTAQSHSAGSPAGVSGSPSDGATCDTKGCHTGGPTAAAESGWITSAIPVAGYTGDSVYTITAVATRANHKRYGFEISVLTSVHAAAGKLISTTGQTQIVDTRYITHTSNGIDGTVGSHTWTFQWQAPARGTGTVTFYGAFNISNDDGTDQGDTIRTSTLSVSEAPTGINNFVMQRYAIHIFPTLVVSGLNITYQLERPSFVKAGLYNIKGRLVQQLFEGNQNTGEQLFSGDLGEINSGLYFILLSINDQPFVQKIIVKN